MNNITNKLEKLNLPDILTFPDGSKVTADRWEERRLQLLEMLRNEEYGHAPEGPFTVTSETVEKANYKMFGGKADRATVRLNVSSDEGSFSFTIEQIIPKEEYKTRPGRIPAFVFINFRPNIPDRIYPTEEVLDRGFAVFRIYYNEITPDNNTEWTGLAEAFDRTKYDWGKIYMWAWAASRVRDYLDTLGDIIDLDNVAVLGHSRLGKTSLWCAANDTRFKYAFVNGSGCSGDSLSRGKEGEDIERIYRVFPHWFCPAFEKYGGKEDTMPFDQHWLVAAVAPRYVVGGGALEDTWADPMSQYLCLSAASPAYELLGLDGFIHPDRMPEPDEYFFDGNIGYFLRNGTHYLSRYDWNRYMDFMDSKMKQL